MNDRFFSRILLEPKTKPEYSAWKSKYLSPYQLSIKRLTKWNNFVRLNENKFTFFKEKKYFKKKYFKKLSKIIENQSEIVLLDANEIIYFTRKKNLVTSGETNRRILNF